MPRAALKLFKTRAVKSSRLGEEDAKHLVGSKAQRISVKTSVKTSVETSVKILELLKVNPTMTLAEIGKTARVVELASSKLVKEAKLHYIGPQKGNQLGVTSQGSFQVYTQVIMSYHFLITHGYSGIKKVQETKTADVFTSESLL